MSEPTSDDPAQPARDLGGGFVLRAAPDALSISAGALEGSGVRGLISPAEVDARLDAPALAWVDRHETLRSRRLCSLDQVHGTSCASAVDGGHSRVARFAAADAIWSSSPDDVLIVRTADCAAIWLVDPKRRLFAMLHAGWRGLAGGIIGSSVIKLREQGADPTQVVAVAGPHIGPCCFEVGPEVAAHFTRVDGAVQPSSILEGELKRTDSSSLNLNAVIESDLREAGIKGSSIHLATACTRCFTASDGSHVLHSYRRNGSGGPLMGSIAFLER